MPSRYARPELLAETEWLAQHLNDPAIRIVEFTLRLLGYERAKVSTPPGANGATGRIHPRRCRRLSVENEDRAFTRVKFRR